MYVNEEKIRGDYSPESMFSRVYIWGFQSVEEKLRLACPFNSK